MKLAVSNIAWDAPEDARVLSLLREQGVAGVEVAPTKLWPDWSGADPAAAAAARARYAEAGFAVPALQAILFGRPDLTVFGDTLPSLVAHVGRVAALAAALGAGVLVFGSPKNRARGALSPDEAMARAEPAFRAMAEACAPHGVTLCLEPNPPAYGCDFATGWRDAAALVRRVDHPHFGLHLDVACLALAGEDAAEAIAATLPLVRHFHVTEPELADFAAPKLDHARIGRAVRGSGYAGWLSIEMRRSADPLRSVGEAVGKVAAWYG